MNNNNFCHLHVHNEYSQLDGFGTGEAYAKQAAKMGFEYLALTNHGNIDGLIKFQKNCIDNGIKPILGCEGFVVPDVTKKSKKRGHIQLLVKNETGFKNLCKMLSNANLEGFYYRPRISYEDLIENCEGLVVSTACMITFLRTHKNKGAKLFEALYDIIGEDLYCEIMPHDSQSQIAANKLKLKFAKRFGCKVIATNDCHYVKRTEWRAQEVLLAIQSKAKWHDPNRWKFNIRGLHLRSAAEMKKQLDKLGFYKREYLTNTLEVAEKCCDYTIPKLDINLPRIKGVPLREKEYLWNLCAKGFEEKHGKNIKSSRKYYRRLKEEYDLIVSKRFTRYFLIVWELINWCRVNNILVGPGRGSVGGSLIAYLIGITAVDPIKHNLLFSRFINEDRIDYPDIDIDFEHSKRHLVRRHLEEMYGESKVAGVSSFNRMKARAVIKDVGRVFDVPYDEINEFTKLIEDNDQHTGIEDAIVNYEDGKKFYENNKRVVKLARKLEGQIRGYSQHAAGVVVSKEAIALSGRCNLLRRGDTLVVNWEKEDTEYVGLMKLDILGLKLMSILADARRLIKENHDKNINYETISTSDPEVFKEMTKGNTVGIFQLNSWATTNLVKEMGIEEFNHISDAVALVRPGPTNSGMTKQYIERKHGTDWDRKDRVYERLTRDTYGLLVYQEQIMAVISKVAGLPYSTADKIRKIIGKKRDMKEFNKYKKQFINGCKKKKIFDKEEAIEFWNGLEKWAQYGFNRSHSVEYALLSYWCGWLKVYYPNEFICANLTNGAKAKKAELVEEAYRLGLQLVLPKVNISNATDWVARKGKLYIPFIEVKGIGKVKAFEAATSPNKGGIRKFYSKDEGSSKHKGALGKLLIEIGAYNPDQKVQITQEIKNKFDFRVVTNPRENYPKLYNIFGDNIRLDRLDDALEGDPKILKKITRPLIGKVRGSMPVIDKLMACSACELREEATRPVAPSKGIRNIMAIGEAPGPREDAEGLGFIGPAGNKLWKALKPKGIIRDQIFVTNIAKCYPKYSKKPNSKQIAMCAKRFLVKEIQWVKPAVILAFGNTSLEFFTGRKSGIIDMSGRVQWNEDYSCWIVYCLHPAAVLHNSENEQYFKAGIKSFSKTVKALGLKRRK